MRLHLEAWRGLLDPYQGLVVVALGAPGFNFRPHLHVHTSCTVIDGNFAVLFTTHNIADYDLRRNDRKIQIETGFDVRLNLEAPCGLLDTHQRLIVVVNDSPRLDLRSHLHELSSCAWCLCRMRA